VCSFFYFSSIKSDLFYFLSFISLSYKALSLIPSSEGKVINDFPLLPIMIILLILVAKFYPKWSLTWTISKPPKCLSLWVITPILPTFLPKVAMQVFPNSHLIQSSILLSLMLNLTVSLTAISGWGNLIVLESWVTMYGILFGPTPLYLTFNNLKLASSGF